MKKVDLSTTNDDQDVNDPELEDENEEDEDDLDLEDEDDEDDDDQPSGKGSNSRRASGANMADVAAELRALQSLVSQNGSTQDKKRVSKLEETIATLATQYKPESLVPLLQMVQAMKEDLTGDYEKAQLQENQRKISSDIEDHIVSRLDTAIAKYGKQLPGMKWAKKTLGEKVIELVNRSKNFESVRAAYGAGRMPARSSLNEAVDKILRTYLKDNGIVKGGNSNAIDSRPSTTRTKSASKANGDIDPSKLDDFERSIYRETLNITKNPELAKEAVRNLGALRR